MHSWPVNTVRSQAPALHTNCLSWQELEDTLRHRIGTQTRACIDGPFQVDRTSCMTTSGARTRIDPYVHRQTALETDYSLWHSRVQPLEFAAGVFQNDVDRSIGDWICRLRALTSDRNSAFGGGVCGDYQEVCFEQILAVLSFSSTAAVITA